MLLVVSLLIGKLVLAVLLIVSWLIGHSVVMGILSFSYVKIEKTNYAPTSLKYSSLMGIGDGFDRSRLTTLGITYTVGLVSDGLDGSTIIVWLGSLDAMC